MPALRSLQRFTVSLYYDMLFFVYVNYYGLFISHSPYQVSLRRFTSGVPQKCLFVMNNRFIYILFETILYKYSSKIFMHDFSHQIYFQAAFKRILLLLALAVAMKCMFWLPLWNTQISNCYIAFWQNNNCTYKQQPCCPYNQ